MENNAQIKEKNWFWVLALILGLVLPISTAATNLLIPLCAIIGAVQGRSLICSLFKKQPIVWCSVGLFLLLAANAFRGNEHLGLDYLSKYRKLIFVPFLALFFLQDTQRCWKLLYGFIIGNIIILTASIVIWTLGDVDSSSNVWFSFNGHHYVAASVMKNAIAQSLLMSIAIFLTAVLAIRFKIRWLWLLVALMIFNVFLISPQRTGYLAVLSMAWWAAWLWLKWRARIVCLFGLVFILSALWFGNTLPAQRAEKGITEVQNCLAVMNTAQQDTVCATSLGLRTFWYSTAIKQIAEQPLLGYGTGNFSVPQLGPFNFSNPHNEYLMQGLQVGLLGIALYIALLFVGWRTAMNLSNPWKTVLSGIFIAYAVCSIFNSLLLDFAEGNTLIILLAVVLAKQVELTTYSVKDKVAHA